jgi:hypothetical protein
MSDQASAEVTALAVERMQARADKDWARSDELRDAIATAGWKVIDTASGFELVARPPFEVYASIKDLVAKPPVLPAVDLVIGLVVAGYPDDVRTCLSALASFAPQNSLIVALDCANVDGAGGVVHEFATEHPGRFAEVHIDQPLTVAGWSASVGALIEISSAPLLCIMDVSTVLEGDAFTPMLEVFDEPRVAVTGWRGVNVNVEDEWRSFTDAGAGEVDAVLGYLMILRTEVARAVPPHPKAKFYRNADMEWCLAIRESGAQIVVAEGELPLRQDRHRGYHDSDPEYRDKESRKTYDRLLQRFRGKTAILHSSS